MKHEKKEIPEPKDPKVVPVNPKLGSEVDTREPHTLPGETPEQRVVRERGTVVLTEAEVHAQEVELARIEAEALKAKEVIVNSGVKPFDSAAASVAHTLSLDSDNPAPKTVPEIVSE